MMNEGKIFLVNVSKGRIGEDNSGLLGGMIITKIQLAAMERVRIPEESRRDFYLYVDEFQNFVTDAFAGILSEARKYRLNLTVAHQYTAQLVVDKSSAVRDAVFGNVGTMIVFRVGSDDAEFLESEFDPEFTPQDLVNLPNYKVYLKLMIDGVTSRPFSAKTLPPMVKSGDKKVEEEVIKSSRALYCRPKEVVEREINDWSGMSLGNDTDTGSGNVEKFPVVCSLCKKETTVPFKPDPGRAVYCKDCIARIKSGEVKVEKGSENQIKHDETKFFKPLADLGIEFEKKDRDLNEDKERYPERVEHHIVSPVGLSSDIALRASQSKNKPSFGVSKSGIIETIKKVFSKSDTPVKPKVEILKKSEKPTQAGGEHTALREVLNKIKESIPEPVSLDTLKNKKSASSKDRAASSEDMSKLKDLISEKILEAKSIPTPIPAPTFTQNSSEIKKPEPVPVSQTPKTQASPIVNPSSDTVQQTSQPREVPEDVLRKILE